MHESHCINNLCQIDSQAFRYLSASTDTIGKMLNVITITVKPCNHSLKVKNQASQILLAKFLERLAYYLLSLSFFTIVLLLFPSLPAKRFIDFTWFSIWEAFSCNYRRKKLQFVFVFGRSVNEGKSTHKRIKPTITVNSLCVWEYLFVFRGFFARWVCFFFGFCSKYLCRRWKLFNYLPVSMPESSVIQCPKRLKISPTQNVKYTTVTNHTLNILAHGIGLLVKSE